MAPNNHTPCSRQKGPSLALTPASAEKAAELTGPFTLISFLPLLPLWTYVLADGTDPTPEN